ncbi:MAG: hypothetical protein Q7R89_03700 [bacterium]|nr:hypothetical protein [bacterium]
METKKETTILSRQAKEKSTLLECFKRVPIIQVACEKSSIARATYYRWLEDDLEFRSAAMEAIAEGESFISDKSEAQLISLIGEKHFGAIKHWLGHRHPAYSAKDKDGRDSKVRIILLHDTED